MRFIDPREIPTIDYAANLNSSSAGITGLTTPDGRITILMPHFERVFSTIQFSWYLKR
ncbi:phosphoribosylformylglycinamidine synthase subunit PurQ [Coxiella-like endosymbiont]|uniref:phosphoribosylformylglycinamidine synthase subunit PurQ n=1 Tax=Coxiella-like endosymbiont TaxID=1592897 RepID=UPI00272B4D25|nr:phosphoribosylformylglycinamidine synthase subunit PurQ [Coxiella-like endosymbiont]